MHEITPLLQFYISESQLHLHYPITDNSLYSVKFQGSSIYLASPCFQIEVVIGYPVRWSLKKEMPNSYPL